MPSESILQLLLQWLLSMAGCFFFLITGALIVSLAPSLAAPTKDKRYGHLFYSLFHGLLFTISLYAVIRAQFISVYIFVLAAYLWAVFPLIKIHRPLNLNFKKLIGYLPLIAGASIFFVIVFNFLPESEYKQNDSFFYLKIAETLQGAGRENISHYYNFFDKAYTGVEPYHYFELWLGAFTMNFTGDLMPHIFVFRIIVYTILSLTFVVGLVYAAECIVNEKTSFAIVVFAFSFLFFLPDISAYSKLLTHYAIYNFENNFLERPNFRTIYLFFLPVLFSLINRETGKRLVFYLICFCVISHLIFLVVVPAILLLYLVYLSFKGRNLDYSLFFSRSNLFAFTGFVLLYIGFYYFLSSKQIPGFYDVPINELFYAGKGRLRFMAISIFTSFAYLFLIVSIFTPVFFLHRKERLENWVLRYKMVLAFLSAVIVMGILMARVFDYKDNAYQLAHLSYVGTSLFIFLVFLYVGNFYKKTIFFLASACVFFGSYFIYKYHFRENGNVNVFEENGAYCYDGKNYDKAYVEKVLNYFKDKQHIVGAYIADTSFYKNLYYSRRNSNVYFMPIHYLIAGKVVSNFDFCLSDSSAIVYNGNFNESQSNYLGNAFQRSFFGMFCSRFPGMNHSSRVQNFLEQYPVKYMVISGTIKPEDVFPKKKYTSYQDKVTGEQFIIFE